MQQAPDLIPLLHLDLVDFSQPNPDWRTMVLKKLQEMLTVAVKFIMPDGDPWKKWARQGTGDGYYLFLDGLGPQVALKIAMNLEAEVARWNRRIPEMPLRMRMTLCYGRVEMVGDQFHGDALIESARLLDGDALRVLETRLWESKQTCAMALSNLFYVAMQEDRVSTIQLPDLKWNDLSVIDKHGKPHHGKIREYPGVEPLAQPKPQVEPPRTEGDRLPPQPHREKNVTEPENSAKRANKPTVIFAYCNEDASWAKRLKAFLYSAGEIPFEIWDQDCVTAGQNPLEELEAALGRAKALVALVSNAIYGDSTWGTYLTKIMKDKPRGLVVHWVPIGKTRPGHLFANIRSLAPTNEPLSSLRRSEVESALVDVAENLCKHL